MSQLQSENDVIEKVKMNEKNKRYGATVLELGLPTRIVRSSAKRKPHINTKYYTRSV